MNENEISEMIIKCAIKIHKKLGPGGFNSKQQSNNRVESNKKF
jgi:hypothetical protein